MCSGNKLPCVPFCAEGTGQSEALPVPFAALCSSRLRRFEARSAQSVFGGDVHAAAENDLTLCRRLRRRNSARLSARSAETNRIIFPDGVYVGKNTSTIRYSLLPLCCPPMADICFVASNGQNITVLPVCVPRCAVRRARTARRDRPAFCIIPGANLQIRSARGGPAVREAARGAVFPRRRGGESRLFLHFETAICSTLSKMYFAA